MPTKRLTELGVSRLNPPSQGQVDYFDAGMPGLVLRVNYGGRKTWRALYYRHQAAKTGKKAGQKISVPTFHALGQYPVLKLEEAREAARKFLADPAKSLSKVDKLQGTFKAVAENFIKRHVEANGLRSQADIERCLNKYVYPTWQDRPLRDIKRSDVNILLDQIADNNGKRMADMILAYVRKLMNWFATRDDDYISPVIRGMKRGTANKRQRVLSEEEVKALWKAAPSCGTFGALCQVALLTAQRKEKLAQMKWDDLETGGTGSTSFTTWTIATEKREKGNAGLLKLPASVLRIIKSQPRVVGCPYVFVGGHGRTYFKTFSNGKKELDAKMRQTLPDMPQWQFHDLRRTARSLMSRAKVLPHIAERVLGHKIPGIEGVYDVSTEYFQERAEALQKLEAMVERIVKPPKSKRHPAQN
jgi:integrase